MAEPTIDYARLLREALQGVLRQVLDRISEIGPTGEVHLYLTFRTDHPGVALPASLRERFPEEMTVELQYQFWDLETDDEAFSVTLSFGGRKALLRIPWDAVQGFLDPEQRFGLSFETPVPDPPEEPEPATREDAEVIPFDRFRRREE